MVGARRRRAGLSGELGLRRSAIRAMAEWCGCSTGAGVLLYRLGRGWLLWPVRDAFKGNDGELEPRPGGSGRVREGSWVLYGGYGELWQ